MTREEAKKNLQTIGVAEPTDEQVTNYLNQVNGETKKEKDRAEQYKKDAEQVKGLKDKVAELESANLSDAEKKEKEMEELRSHLAEVEKKNARMETLNTLAQMGITGEDAENLIREDGSTDFATLGKIISARESAAAIAKEKEIAKGSSNPGGGTDDNNPDANKPEDVKNAEAITFGAVSQKEDVVNYYKK